MATGVPAGGGGGIWTLLHLEVGRHVLGITGVPVTVPIRKLPPDLAGLRIVQLSDLHVGPTIRRRFVEVVVDAAIGLAPDLVAVTGDVADGYVSELRDHVAPLAGLRAPLGTFFVTGNH